MHVRYRVTQPLLVDMRHDQIGKCALEYRPLLPAGARAAR